LASQSGAISTPNRSSLTGTGARLTFQKIQESSSRPSKLHLDLTADDRRAEVRRLRNLGASELREVNVEDDWTWTVMADPDGNEFCVTDP
jgi:hypothetical protein